MDVQHAIAAFDDAPESLVLEDEAAEWSAVDWQLIDALLSNASPPEAASSDKCCTSSTSSNCHNQSSQQDKAALRRQRHRETMRRSRQRTRDQLKSLHVMVQELEALKHCLLTNDQIRPECKQFVMVQQQLAALQQENYALRQRMMTFPFDMTPHKETPPAKQTLCDVVQWDATTTTQCLALVQQSYDDIMAFEEALASNSNENTTKFKHVDATVNLMGWCGRRRVVPKGTALHFTFEKTFCTRSSEEVCDRTWRFCQQTEAFAQMFAPVCATMDLEIIRRLNDQLIVMRRVQEEAEANNTMRKYRSIYLLYRLDTADVSFIVFRSVNPTFTKTCTCAGNAWIEHFHWFGFTPLATGGCRVRFGGSLDAQSKEFAHRWMRELFFALLRWEAINVAPFLLL